MRPLAGVRVLDASNYVSGPFATLSLADLGADVVKIEPPKGDPLRRFGVRRAGLSLQFAATNANKRSVSLDLKSSEGAAALRSMLRDADVLVTNWRPSVDARLGLAPAAVRREFQQLVWVRLSGYGPTGPLADRPAFDSILQARTGAVGVDDPRPRLARGYLADKVAGMFAAQGVLAALVHRQTSGQGAVVDLAMLDALAYFHGPDLFAAHVVVDAPAPDVVRHLGAARPVRAADGWMVVSPVSREQLRATMLAVGRPEWIDRLREVADAADLATQVYALLDEVLPARTCGEWEATFEAADVPASRVLDTAEHLDDPQVRHNRTYHDIHDPVLGPCRRLRHPALFDGAPSETDDLPAPPLGRPGGGR